MADLIMGTPSRFQRIDKFQPKQTNILDQLAQLGLGGLQSGSTDFAPIEQRELQRYHQETLPGIRQSFTGSGTGTGQRSSGFLEALDRGSTNLGTNLAAMRSQHGLAQQQNLLKMLGIGLTPQQEIGYFSGRQGLAQGLAPAAGQALGSAASAYFGGTGPFAQTDAQKAKGGGGGIGTFGKILGGAGTGASIGGSIGGPVGAAIGAGGGTILALLASLLSGKKSSGSVTAEGL